MSQLPSACTRVGSLQDRFDGARNPDGFICLAVAENVLAYEALLRPKLAAALGALAKGSAGAGGGVTPFYDDMRGHGSVRRAVCALLDEVLLGAAAAPAPANANANANANAPAPAMAAPAPGVPANAPAPNPTPHFFSPSNLARRHLEARCREPAQYRAAATRWAAASWPRPYPPSPRC